nr:RNA polymerase sigma factor [Planctomycetota bacterium]
AVNYLRRSARVRNVELTEADAKVQADVDEPAEDPLLEPLRRALSRLSPDYREILALKYEANCDYQKIAETLGLSLANVEKKLYRARQALLKLMPEIGKTD